MSANGLPADAERGGQFIDSGTGSVGRDQLVYLGRSGDVALSGTCDSTAAGRQASWLARLHVQEPTRL
jgi:hypothetical protein